MPVVCRLALLPLLLLCGCGFHGGGGLFAHAPPPLLENPLFVPQADYEFVWSQVVDAVDDHFRIEREERIRLIGNVLTEGRLETLPSIASGYLEPWRHDSAPGYERSLATLQTIRRRASLRAIPTDGGVLIEVQVFKELEDLDRPASATVGAATLRHDGSLVSREETLIEGSVRLGWIPLGRDLALEQRLLADIHARLNVAAPRPAPGPVF